MVQIIPSWLNKKVELRDSLIHGKGMFAKESIKKGDVVAIWGGIYLSKEELDLNVQKKNSKTLIMQFDDDLFSIEERGDDETYFINHSCNPNVWMGDEITLVARTGIKKGEELAIDYALFKGGSYVSKTTGDCTAVLNTDGMSDQWFLITPKFHI